MAKNSSSTGGALPTLLDESVSRPNGHDNDNDDQWSNACSDLDIDEVAYTIDDHPVDRTANHAREDSDAIQGQLVSHCYLSETATEGPNVVEVEIDLDCSGSSGVQPEELGVTQEPGEADTSPKTCSN
ncbi:hypothetical protein PV08_00777 [Exophiala spinifera]|uniref:Uncharacterized protein n=1 Tax=Exophiala spinifera TaxID=91928 RepID=A0A0D2A5Z0_9EURO|nr:uncharacterized protein PV08_00777 [Exophiala spinifera]KIW20202.1 hypothetical protein PV08_00777 [Exophiala spinifera]